MIEQAILRLAEAVEANTAELRAIRESAAGNVVPLKPAAPAPAAAEIPEDTVPTKVAAPAKKAAKVKPVDPAPEQEEPEAEAPPVVNAPENAAAGDDRPEVEEFEDPAEFTAILGAAAEAAKQGAAKAGDKRAAFMAAFEACRAKHGIVPGERLSTLQGGLKAARAFKADVEAITV